MKARNPKVAEKGEISRIWQRAMAQARRDTEKEQENREKESRKFFRALKAKQRKLPKPSLSQLNFQTQHWWTPFITRRDGMAMDEEKAALIYEAMRRHPEVQRAWLKKQNLIGESGWQIFVGYVVIHLRQSWVELDEITRGAMRELIHSPWFVPPRGYSTFPDKSGSEKCRKAAMQVLRLPNPAESASAAQAFVTYAQKFVDAGFLIVAVDNKTKQGVRYAAEAIERLQRSFRKADLIEIATPHLPADLPQAEIDALEKKRKKGTLTHVDISAAWRTHDERRRKREFQEVQQRLTDGKTIAEINWEEETNQLRATETGGGWQTLVSSKTGVMDKRERKGQLIESKAFDFIKICRELEQLDAGKIAKSDFVSRLRLG